MIQFPISFDFDGKTYWASFVKIGSGNPVFFELHDVEPNDFEFPPIFAYSIYRDTDEVHYPGSIFQYPPDLIKTIWKSIHDECQKQNITLDR